jgi:hypothetical protein
MKNEEKKKEVDLQGDRKISRKEAIKKAGYAAFSAATMLVLLNDPAKAQQIQSDTHDSPAPLTPFDDWG